MRLMYSCVVSCMGLDASSYEGLRMRTANTGFYRSVQAMHSPHNGRTGSSKRQIGFRIEHHVGVLAGNEFRVGSGGDHRSIVSRKLRAGEKSLQAAPRRLLSKGKPQGAVRGYTAGDQYGARAKLPGGSQ